MIRHYCDRCGEQLRDGDVSGTQDYREGRITVRVIVSVGGFMIPKHDPTGHGDVCSQCVSQIIDGSPLIKAAEIVEGAEA